MHEGHGGSCFITLTYRDPKDCTDQQLEDQLHVPADWSLHRSHYQNFLKRLRSRLEGVRLRYYLAGEYGRNCRHGVNVEAEQCPYLCKLGRPHFHVLLFGWMPDDLEIYNVNLNEPRFTSPFVEEVWSYGFVDVGDVNFASAAYVARYVLKKQTGAMADERYTQVDPDTGEVLFFAPEFAAMSRGRPCRKHVDIESRRPKIDIRCDDCEGGIGWSYYRQYKGDMFPSDEVAIPGGGIIKKVPRYYEELFKEEDPLTLLEIKERRREHREDNAEEYSSQRLYDKYRVNEARIRHLRRNKDDL